MLAKWVVHYLTLWFPGIFASNRGIVESVLLFPLQCYEAVIVLPVSFFRRHMPVLGGALVVIMTLHGMVLRWLIALINQCIDTFLYSRDPRHNFNVFWNGIRDRYASFEDRNVDWTLAQRLFGDKMNSSISQEDLWTALVDSILLFDDPSMSISNSSVQVSSRTLIDLTPFQHSAIHDVRKYYLIERGGSVANNFVFGLLNPEISTGWRIGYIAITAMEGFVEIPIFELFPKKEALQIDKSKLTVPERYDIESMRWVIEAILASLGQIDGLICDIRLNQGGGSHLAALNLASFFTDTNNRTAFSVTNRLPGAPERFSAWRKCRIPSTVGQVAYTGPVVLLQSQHTCGTAEMFSLSLSERPQTFRIGSRSMGSISQVAQFSLPNGWKVRVPFQRYASPTGEQYEDSGVPVDLEINLPTSDICRPNDSCIKAAIDHLMNRRETRQRRQN